MAVAWRHAGGVPLKLGGGLDGGDGGDEFLGFVFVCILLFYNDIICLFLYFLLQCNMQGRQVLSHHICGYGGVTVLGDPNCSHWDRNI